MRTIGNILWFLLAGLWLAVGSLVAGVVMCILIITIPFGVASFRLAGYALWPFGRVVVRKPTAGAASVIGNIIWFLLAGLWLAIAQIAFGLVLCITITGIPFGIASFKMAGLAVAPLGKESSPGTTSGRRKPFTASATCRPPRRGEPTPSSPAGSLDPPAGRSLRQ